MNIKKRYLVILGAVVLLSVAAGGAVFAREIGLGAAVTGTGSGVCKYGYDTRTAGIAPTTALVAGSVQFTKTCAGPTEGRFTSETVIGAGGFVDIQMTATCIATGGQADPCLVGEVENGSPGPSSTFFAHNPGSYETHAMNMIWPALKRGTWRFPGRRLR